MRDRQWILVCTAVLLAVWPAGSALGAKISGRASTVLEWYDDPQEDTAVPIYQYLLVNAQQITDKGLSFAGYGRVATDLTNEVDIDSRLYYAYLEQKELIADLDVRLGRQFISTTAGASVLDGLYLKYHDWGPMDVTLFGGGDVTYYEGYNARDLVWGAEVSGRFVDRLDLGLSYLQKWDGSDLTHELFGLDVDYELPGRAAFYNETQFNYLANSISYFLIGAKYFGDPKWSLRGEYLYSQPLFSSLSIFSVFAADEYEEVLAEFTYKLGPGLRSFARYTRELYLEVDDANVFEAGVEKIRTRHFSGYLTAMYRDDDEGQDLKGFKIRGAYYFNKKLEAGLGLHLDVLERRLEETDETTSRRYWADVTAHLNKTVSVQAKIENVESDLWDRYTRGRLRLNVSF